MSKLRYVAIIVAIVALSAVIGQCVKQGMGW
jgi:hypothetical protein